MLSQLETGKLVPTLPTLARISMVFDVGLDHFFGGKRREAVFSIVRAKERIRFPDHSGAAAPNFFFECLAFSTQNKSLQAYLAEKYAISGSFAEVPVSNDVMKLGTGTATLAGDNTYNGETTVMEGTLAAASDTALGATTAGTVVLDGATLALDNTNIDPGDASGNVE